MSACLWLISNAASSCCFSHAKIYSTIKHLCFKWVFRSVCKLSVCGRGFYTCRINKVYHILQHACSAILLREPSHKFKTAQTLQQERNSTKRKGKKDRKKKTLAWGPKKEKNRKGTRTGAICWQWNVSHGEDERAEVDEMKTAEWRREVTGNSRSPACATFVWFKSN